ncbi:MAG: hypothetical protein KQH57_20815 [Actinomycetales bacterium]|nr:hypothetical protein [Actinomycetales bacterium]
MSPDPSGHQPVGPELHRWVALLVEEFDVSADAVDVDAVLDLAREAAQAVSRPAVPLTGFLAGYAVARAGGDRAAFDRVAARIGELAAHWDQTA